MRQRVTGGRAGTPRTARPGARAAGRDHGSAAPGRESGLSPDAVRCAPAHEVARLSQLMVMTTPGTAERTGR